MDTLLSLRVFCAVAELRSFTDAAEQLGMSTAMASKHVKHLERRVSARLLQRTSRNVSLTEAGERYLARVRGLIDDLAEVEGQIGDATALPEGKLRVSLPVWMANASFVRGLAQFHSRHPKVQLDLNVTGRKVNLVEEGMDLALRATFTPEEGLVARPLAEMPFYLLASPVLLARLGRPTRLEELSRQPMLAYSPVMPEDRVKLKAAGAVHEITFKTVLRSDNETLLLLAAREHLGYVFAPQPLVAEDLAAGRLEIVLPELITPRVPLFAVYAHRRYLPGKLRAFLEFVTQTL